MTDLTQYRGLLAEIKTRIQTAQTRAVLAVNTELIRLYWQIGQLLDVRQAQEGWGSGVIPRLAQDIRNELPEIKGFSERNLKRMLAFYRAYAQEPEFVPQLVAQIAAGAKVPQAVALNEAQADLPCMLALPWGHHILLLERVKDVQQRRWYMTQTLACGWSRSVLALQIDGAAHARQGKAVTRCKACCPASRRLRRNSAACWLSLSRNKKHDQQQDFHVGGRCRSHADVSTHWGAQALANKAS